MTGTRSCDGPSTCDKAIACKCARCRSVVDGARELLLTVDVRLSSSAGQTLVKADFCY
jgi:hypothetical protein